MRGLATVGTVVVGLSAVYVVALLAGMADPSWALYARGVLHLAELALVVALVGTGAAGRGGLARAGAGVAGLGLVGMAVGEGTTDAAPGLSDWVFQIAPLLVGLGMLVVGIEVLRAGVWRDWRRIAPVALGIGVFVVVLPLVIASGGPPSPLGLVGVLVWEVLWLGIGGAVLSAAQRTAVPA